MPLLEICVAVLSGLLTLTVGLFIRKINIRDRRAEERQQELISCRFIEMKYTRSVGSLAHLTAQEVKKAKAFPIGNGDMEKAIVYFKEQEHELEDFYQRVSAANNIKGM